MHSAVAQGEMRHRRFSPREHRFAYQLSMLYLDLDEAPALLAQHPLWSWNRWNLACVLRRDHLRRDEPDLAQAVRHCIHDFAGVCPQGPITLLTQPRYFGYCINPISVYFVWSADRGRLEWVLLEVHNTPWEEQHPYVLKAPASQQGAWSLDFSKAMHVSPFMAMDMKYRLRLQRRPDQGIRLSLENWREQERLFVAHLNLDLQPASRKALSRLVLRHPFMTAKVAAAIYYQALRIKLKGVPYVPYPGRHTAKPSGVSR